MVNPFNRSQRLYTLSSKLATANHEWMSFDLKEDYYFDSIFDGTILYHISYHYNKKKSELFVSYLDETKVIKIGNNLAQSIDFANQEILESKKILSFRNSFLSIRNDTEARLQFLPYYSEPLPYMMRSSQWHLNINNCLDTTINGNKKTVYNGTTKIRFLKDQSSGKFNIPLQYECQTWIDAETHQVDSVIAFNITENSFNEKVIYRIENLDFRNQSSHYDSIFDIDSPKYTIFSKHDDNNLPNSALGTNKDKLETQNLTYPIINLYRDTTNLSKKNGWLLLDLWMFGCGGCDNCFLTFKQETDSLGYRILEKQNITLLSVNALSNNLEMINDYANKYSMEEIMYSSKGFNTKLSLVNYSYPSYYLISPKKEIIWRSNSLGDYSELLEAKANYEKQHQSR
jgi:hypothetical protein